MGKLAAEVVGCFWVNDVCVRVVRGGGQEANAGRGEAGLRAPAGASVGFAFCVPTLPQ